MAPLNGSRLHLGLCPELLLLTALVNYFIDVSLSVRPMTASCREQDDIAERFFRMVDLAVLQFGDTLVPQRLLLALTSLQLSPVSFLAEFPAQAGGERVQRSI